MPYLKYCISTAETLVSEILVQDIAINFLTSTGISYSTHLEKMKNPQIIIQDTGNV